MRLITIEKYDRLIAIYEHIMLIYDGAMRFDEDDDIWRDAYDGIFGAGYCRMVYECVPNFEWYDPDASYKEDVSAFVWALQDLMKNIKVA